MQLWIRVDVMDSAWVLFTSGKFGRCVWLALPTKLYEFCRVTIKKYSLTVPPCAYNCHDLNYEDAASKVYFFAASHSTNTL